MLTDPAELAALLAHTDLANSSILALDIPGSEHKALAISLKAGQDLGAWELMHAYRERTQRYPVITTLWGAYSQNWAQDVMGSDLFSRFYYEEEALQWGHQAIYPEQIIARIAEVDLDPLLAQTLILTDPEWDAELSFNLTATASIFGQAPTETELQSFQDNLPIRSKHALEQWLFHWEQNYSQAHHLTPDIDTTYLDWFEPGMTKALLLLPTPHSWESLAYLHWFGACQVGSEVAMGFLKCWYQEYQAELVCHHGTILQLQVGQRPQSPETAWQLALEHYALAPYTLDAPGITIRHHAQALLTFDRWLFHERP